MMIKQETRLFSLGHFLNGFDAVDKPKTMIYTVFFLIMDAVVVLLVSL